MSRTRISNRQEYQIIRLRQPHPIAKENCFNSQIIGSSTARQRFNNAITISLLFFFGYHLSVLLGSDYCLKYLEILFFNES